MSAADWALGLHVIAGILGRALVLTPVAVLAAAGVTRTVLTADPQTLRRLRLRVRTARR